MKKILSILTVGCALTLSSCEDWLDKYPLAQMSPETFFSNENELQAFSNTFYTIFPGDGLYNEGYDNIVKNEIAAEMRDGRTIPASGGGWTWTDLRKFNTLLEYSGNCKDTDIRNRYDAVARFFRAYFYFEKVKRFGDVPWYAKPLGSADPELKRPRDSREFVMQRMIEDIDFAIRYLPAERDLYRVTKWTALALKSRFCLFEGTFRKYHSIDGYEHDWKWYLEQAADAAEEFITNSGYSLYTATGPATSYRDLFASENAQSVEVILARDYNSALGVFHNANFYTISASYGKPGMTRKIVDSYLMADGSRFTDKAGWETMEFKQQCSNRDPRLAESIVEFGTDFCGVVYDPRFDVEQVWDSNVGRNITNPDNIVTASESRLPSRTGLVQRKGIDKDWTDDYQADPDKIIMRYADVLLMYAEAKIELNEIDDATLEAMNRVRARAYGVQHTETDKYPAIVTRSQSELRTILRTERRMEFAFERLRIYDLLRWRIAEKVLNYSDWTIKYNAGANVLKKVMTDGQWFIPTPAIDESGCPEMDATFSRENRPHITALYNRVFNPEIHYLWPLPATDVLVNKNLKQNYGY